MHDLGTAEVWRPGPDGTLTPRQEPRRAMSVVVDGRELIDHGLMIDGSDALVAYTECGVCGEWSCNLVEGYAAAVRRFGPYVLWITPWDDGHVFGIDAYAGWFGPVDVPALDATALHDLPEPDPAWAHAAHDGRVVAGTTAEPAVFTDLMDWPLHGSTDVLPVEPPAVAVEVPSVLAGGRSIWIDVAPRADGRRAAYLPAVTRAPVWCAGPAVDRLIDALRGPE